MTHDLLFTYDFPPMGGGIARFMEALAIGYPPGMLQVSTGTLPGAAQVDARFPNHVDRLAVNSHRLRTVQGLVPWCRRAAKLAADPAARFAWCDGPRPSGYPGQWAFQRTGLPYGIMHYGSDLITLRTRIESSWLKRRILLPILGDAAVHLAISHWTAETCRALFNDAGLPLAADRVRVVPLGTDPERWHPDPAGAEEFRVRRGLPAGRYLVTVARLHAFKGVDTGIGILTALGEDFPDLRYAVVGRGEHARALRQLAQTNGVSDRVHFLDDVTDTELPSAYALGKIYLGLTREEGIDIEGFGISLLEAAATGLPVVACNSGGIPDAVDDGTTGILVDQRDPAAATGAVRLLLTHPDKARQMGESGRLRVLKEFTWQRVVANLIQLSAELGRTPES